MADNIKNSRVGVIEENRRLREENKRLKEQLDAEAARADAMRDAHAKDALSLERRLDDAMRERDVARDLHEGQQRNTLAFMRERDEAVALLRRWSEIYTDADTESDEYSNRRLQLDMKTMQLGMETMQLLAKKHKPKAAGEVE